MADNSAVSAFTKRTLEQFGWTEQDGIPDTLGEFLIAAKDRSAPTTRTDVMVDAEKMRPEDVETAKKMVADYQAIYKDKKAAEAIEEKIRNMAPDVAAAYKQMLDAQKSTTEKPEIVDDR